MSNSFINLHIKKVAVLGAGVMGAQIAAHLVNAGITPLLFDLASKGDERSQLSINAIENLRKLKPTPIGNPNLLDVIYPANYDDHLPMLTECDLILEAISERMDWKIELYNKIAPYINKNCILATNTSGLSINKLAQILPEDIRPRFLGIHFFNPPRYMKLVELIPHEGTDHTLIEKVEAFIVSALGKGAVHAKDTPNFIGNRVGMFSILSIIYHAEQMNLAPDIVDLLTGQLIGRPRSATFRTLDIVGLDTFAHVVNTMSEGLLEDPWHKFYKLPQWMLDLISKGALGQKTKVGIFKRVETTNFVYDIQKNDYRESENALKPEILTILKNTNLTEKFTALKNSELPEAKFLWTCFRDLFHYAAYHLMSIADCTRDVDFALRWGYAWASGPFETWQAIGWQTVANWIKQDIDDKKTMCLKPLPEWVEAIGNKGVYYNNSSYSPSKKKFQPRSTIPVYKRQPFPEPIYGETFDKGSTIFETDAVRLWETGDNIAILSFKTKMNTVNEAVLNGVLESVAKAEVSNAGLVIWQSGNHFSLGANLQDMLNAIANGKPQDIERLLEKFQQASLALRYSKIPTVAAPVGMVLGGGCELMLHCTRTIAAFESMIGLVEVGVGLIPAGGGCKEMARKACLDAKEDSYSLESLKYYFHNIFKAERSSCAPIAKILGYLRESDSIIMNPYELLYTAKQQVLSLIELGYKAPLAEKIYVAGKTGYEMLEAELNAMQSNSKISGHDHFIGVRLARVICGGNIEKDMPVDESDLLKLERDYFMELIETGKTQDRITHTLKTGKMLSN